MKPEIIEDEEQSREFLVRCKSIQSSRPDNLGAAIWNLSRAIVFGATGAFLVPMMRNAKTWTVDVNKEHPLLFDRIWDDKYINEFPRLREGMIWKAVYHTGSSRQVHGGTSVGFIERTKSPDLFGIFLNFVLGFDQIKPCRKNFPDEMDYIVESELWTEGKKCVETALALTRGAKGKSESLKCAEILGRAFRAGEIFRELTLYDSRKLAKRAELLNSERAKAKSKGRKEKESEYNLNEAVIDYLNQTNISAPKLKHFLSWLEEIDPNGDQRGCVDYGISVERQKSKQMGKKGVFHEIKISVGEEEFEYFDPRRADRFFKKVFGTFDS